MLLNLDKLQVSYDQQINVEDNHWKAFTKIWRVFLGEVEKVQKFFEFTAFEVRENLALLGFKTLEEIIGQSSLLEFKEKTKDQSIKLGLESLKERYRPKIHFFRKVPKLLQSTSN